MNTIKWDSVFINNHEIKAYLDNSEFNKLIKLSKFVRLKLKPRLFENFIINQKTIDKLLKDFIKSDTIADSNIKKPSKLPLNEYIPLFNKCFKQLLTHTKSIHINQYTSHYLLLELSNILPHLTTLSIYGTSLSLTTFRSTIANLQNLENLSLEIVSFIYYKGESSSINDIHFPNTLKSLYWQHCGSYLCSLEEDPKLINFKYAETLTNRALLKIPPINLPNLKILSTKIEDAPINSELLLANPQLISLDFNFREFNDSHFRLFSLIQNIKKLELTVTTLEIDLNLDLVEDFTLPNLTKFISNKACTNNWPLLEKIISSSPNLIDIGLLAKISLIPDFMKFVKNLDNLEKLTIIATEETIVNIDHFIPGKNLKQMELGINLNTNQLLEETAYYTNLKVISFKKDYFHKKITRNFNQETTPNPWRLIIIGDFIKYYK